MRTFRKYLSLFAIAVGLTLTSCVKDTESDSVSKLRDSKAKLNDAQAALNTAQADAARLTAEAAKIQADAQKLQAEGEKALALAQAAYHEALAAQVAAATAEASALAAVKLDQAKVALDSLKENLKKQQKEVEQSIKEIEQAMLEAELTHQKEMAKLEGELKQAIATANSVIATQLTTLVSQYYTALTNIQAVKNNISTATLNITKAEAEIALLLVDSVQFVRNYEVAQKAAIRAATASKAQNTAALEQWKAAIQAPGSSALLTAKKTELKDLEASLQGLVFDRNAAEKVKDEKDEVLQAATDDLNEYNSLLNSLSYGGSVWTHTSEWILASGYDSTLSLGGKVFTYKQSWLKDGEYHYVGFSPVYASPPYYTGEIFAKCSYGVYYEWMTPYRSGLSSPAFSGNEDIVKTALKNHINKLKQDSIKYTQEYEDYSAKLALVLPKLETANNAVLSASAARQRAADTVQIREDEKDAAQHVWQDALSKFNAKVPPQPRADSLTVHNARVRYDGAQQFALPVTGGLALDPTGGANGRYNRANNAYNTANEALTVAEAALERVKTEIYATIVSANTAKNNLNTATDELAVIYPNAAIINSTSRAALQAKIDAAQAEYDVANEEYTVLSDEYTERITNTIPTLRGEITQLELYYNANGDAHSETYVQERIDHYTKEIILNEQAIAKAEENLRSITTAPGYTSTSPEGVGTALNSRRNTIASLKVSIEGYKAQLAGYEAAAALYKESIDSLLN